MNSLSGGAAGGAAGGSDFNPENKSEAEIQRFCQCFMNELSKYLGPDIDHPGMGLGVGAREIGYMYGQWKRTHQVGAQRGRGLLWGGAAPFPHATGFGVAHFAEALLQDKKATFGLGKAPPLAPRLLKDDKRGRRGGGKRMALFVFYYPACCARLLCRILSRASAC